MNFRNLRVFPDLMASTWHFGRDFEGSCSSTFQGFEPEMFSNIPPKP